MTLLAMMILGIASPSRADVFHLRGGGQVEGEQVSSDGNLIRVRSVSGEVALAADQVISIEKIAKPAPSAYSKMKDACPATADGHYELAQWCRQHDLPNLCRQELLAALTLDASFAKAHLALGHVNVGSIWLDGGDGAATSRPASAAAPDAGAAARKAEAAVRVADLFRKASEAINRRDARQFGLILGQIIKLDPNNGVARNDLGVLAANQGEWGTAFNNLAKAAVNSDKDAVLDNLDLAMAKAANDRAAALVVTEGDRILQAAVQQMHAAHRHLGMGRWGNTWLAEEHIQTMRDENAQIDRQIARSQSMIGPLQAKCLALQQSAQHLREAAAFYHNEDDIALYSGQADYDQSQADGISQQIDALTGQIQDLQAKQHAAPHAADFVMLDQDGGKLLK
jgi:hypothetical protein